MHDRYLETFIWARNETLKDIFEFIDSIRGASKYQSFFKMSRKILISFLFLYIYKKATSVHLCPISFFDYIHEHIRNHRNEPNLRHK